ncbi:hypothetical protein DWG18_08585 [Lysobacter sp. TY2-98]|uniref:hypothetical protein n=1 Tax=Lysobacter sp. TY2-98 TaxID=2290922 RepID=UPI000E2096A0|nr:hypothetical protein [Lysobacter sp. TY2-98]AXK72333.1 hypothetical protein DWG18_08585 [Lysobacter sp. TY2-98]
MSKRRHRLRVFLTETGRIELATLLTPWLRVGSAFGGYVECRKVDLDNAYVELTLDLQADDDDTVDVKLSVPHHCIAAVLETGDFEAFAALYAD